MGELGETLFKYLGISLMRNIPDWPTRIEAFLWLMAAAAVYTVFKHTTIALLTIFERERVDPRIQRRIKQLPSKALDAGIGAYVSLKHAGRYLKNRVEQIERERDGK